MGVMTDYLEVLSGVATWLIGTFADIQPMFWTAESGLTLLGTMSAVGVSIGVFLLVMGIIQRFMKFGA